MMRSIDEVLQGVAFKAVFNPLELQVYRPRIFENTRHLFFNFLFRIYGSQISILDSDQKINVIAQWKYHVHKFGAWHSEQIKRLQCLSFFTYCIYPCLKRPPNALGCKEILHQSLCELIDSVRNYSNYGAYSSISLIPFTSKFSVLSAGNPNRRQNGNYRTDSLNPSRRRISCLEIIKKYKQTPTKYSESKESPYHPDTCLGHSCRQLPLTHWLSLHPSKTAARLPFGVSAVYRNEA